MKAKVKLIFGGEMDFDDFEQVIDGLRWKTAGATYIGAGGDNETLLRTPGLRYFAYHHPIRQLRVEANITPVTEAEVIVRLGRYSPDQLAECFPEVQIQDA